MASDELEKATMPPPPTMLVGMFVDRRNRGKSWQEIAEEFGVPVDEVYRDTMDYYNSATRMTDAEYRLMQLTRLEKMIDAVWDLAIESKSLDHIDTLLKILQEISKLLGLNKQKAVTEIQVIDQRQQTLVINYVDAVAATLYNRVLNAVTSKASRATIEQKWDAWVADAAKEPLKAITTDKVKV